MIRLSWLIRAKGARGPIWRSHIRLLGPCEGVRKKWWWEEKHAEMMLTLLAGFTRVVYQSGLFCRLISYLVTSTFAS